MISVVRFVATIAFAWLVLPGPANADYIVTGKIRGQQCTSYIVFDHCSTRSIDAVKGKDGRLYTIKRRYPKVSDYSEKKGLCWINTKSRGGGLITGAMNLFLGVTFFEKKQDGSFKELDIEYLVFPCVKTD